MPQTVVSSRVALLETMLRIRAYEEKLASLADPQMLGRMPECDGHGARMQRAHGCAGAASGRMDAQEQQPGICTSVGQEACAAGVIAALETRDRILTNHRSAGHLLARGADPRRMVAEVMGRSDGYCKGKSGSRHISVKELGIVLTSTIAGGELSMVTGVALAQKLGYGEAGGITACFFGDGAACEGVFHESLNLAATWDLPVLYACENNQWQGFVHRRETMRAEHLSSWAQKFDMPAVIVDGNDVEAVHAVAREAIARVRRTGRPYFLELQTYRQRGHFELDDQAYVDQDELECWKKRDPIEAMSGRLLDAKAITTTELAALRQRAAEEIDAAILFAQFSPWPSPAELTSDVYA
jgi:TPP-dependent pyruvate/acetoin dehydrogenase alpha subunit